MTVVDVAAVATALGATLDVRIRWQGERLDRLLDAAHAALVEDVVRLLRDLGWETAIEVSFNVRGERGSIDVAAFWPRTRAVVVVEAKSVVPDLQSTLATLDRKTRLAPFAIRPHMWVPSAVSRVLVIRESRTSRRRLEEHGATIEAAFPLRGRQLVAWLRSPDAAAVSGLLLLPDSRPRGASRATRTSPARIRAPSSVATGSQRSRPGPARG